MIFSLSLSLSLSIVQGADWHWGPAREIVPPAGQSHYIRYCALVTFIIASIFLIGYLTIQVCVYEHVYMFYVFMCEHLYRWCLLLTQKGRSELEVKKSIHEHTCSCKSTQCHAHTHTHTQNKTSRSKTVLPRRSSLPASCQVCPSQR